MHGAITSAHNSRVKAVAKLQRQGRERRRRGLFCIEAWRELARAVAAGFVVAELYHVQAWPGDDERGRAMVEQLRHAGGFVSEVSEGVLAKISYREHPEGFVAVVRARHATLRDVDAAAGGVGGVIVVCSGLEKPGNVGAIVRSAAGAGAGAVVIDAEDFDVFNPNCIRASTGAVFALPIVRAARDAVIAWLRDRGRAAVALSPEAERSYTEVDWRRPSAIVLGAEASGLDAAWREAADETVRIPLASDVVDSLNVSAAAAVVLFEAARQRQGR